MFAKDHDIPLALLREQFVYDQVTGRLKWRSSGMVVGGTPHVDRYRRIELEIGGKKRTFAEHRVCWALAHGEWPRRGYVIDHQNHNCGDNRLCNLRVVTQSENVRNRRRDIVETPADRERLFMRRLFFRVAARKQRAERHRVEVLLGDEDWAAFERLRERLGEALGRRVTDAEAIRAAIRRAGRESA